MLPYRHRHRVEPPGPIEGRRIVVRGTVQGVGFRPWVYRIAGQASVTGRVRNDGTGVTIEVFGSRHALDRFASLLGHDPPPAAKLDRVFSREIPPETLDGFTIVESESGTARHVSIPPELATCPACLREIFDPVDRRFRYAFTNCTDCGPRYTIARDVPYDRARTSMAVFPMCDACRREYEDPTSRRFHAQPNACPVCGPRLRLMRDGRDEEVPDPLAAAADALKAGRIVAVKGLGGYHLACDATSEAAVTRLRARKHRDEKPFAVMVRDLRAAERIAVLGQEERRLLQSVERPIVLAWRHDRAELAEAVAPESDLVGIFLPYTPLHHLLLADANRPLVMTSGNRSDEPMVFRDEDAVSVLGDIADVLLVHDREIVSRCDDSVVTVIAREPVVFRRSRGYVPRRIALPHPLAAPVLATGALLKNTFCLAAGDEAWLGPHVGDLDSLETMTAFVEAVERMERFIGITPAVVAHDMHPDYPSTRYALGRAGVRTVAVQHHHAHVASVMAEHGLDGPVIGVAFDGTGLGTDGTAWGGEVLVADAADFTRAATCRALRLPGGDIAVRQPWRIALAALDELFGGDPPLDALSLFAPVPAGDVALVRQMVASGINTPLARGIGRYFDLFGAIALGRGTVTFEGQLALAFNVAADPAERGRYEFAVEDVQGLPQLDLSTALREAVFEVIGGAGAAAVSAKFHNTLACATAELVRIAARRHGALPVVLTGGCFQNPRLTESVLQQLSRSFHVLTHRDVPPGDGGLALGQALVAGAH